MKFCLFLGEFNRSLSRKNPMIKIYKKINKCGILYSHLLNLWFFYVNLTLKFMWIGLSSRSNLNSYIIFLKELSIKINSHYRCIPIFIVFLHIQGNLD